MIFPVCWVFFLAQHRKPQRCSGHGDSKMETFFFFTVFFTFVIVTVLLRALQSIYTHHLTEVKITGQVEKKFVVRSYSLPQFLHPTSQNWWERGNVVVGIIFSSCISRKWVFFFHYQCGNVFVCFYDCILRLSETVFPYRNIQLS